MKAGTPQMSPLEDMVGAQYIAGAESATLFGVAMDWLEDLSGIQQQAFLQLQDDWRESALALSSRAPSAVLVDHLGRRIQHLATTAEAVRQLAQRETDRMLQTHQKLWQAFYRAG